MEIVDVLQNTKHFQISIRSLSGNVSTWRNLPKKTHILLPLEIVSNAFIRLSYLFPCFLGASPMSIVSLTLPMSTMRA